MASQSSSTGPIRSERRGRGGRRGQRDRHRGGRGGDSSKRVGTELDVVNSIEETRQVVANQRALSPTSGAVSGTRFSEFYHQGLIGDALFANIPYEYCTQVQAATLERILRGDDVFARAKTGTGKTMAFLIPTIQQLIINPPAHSRLISILVISPTRELAMQIMAEAQKLINNNPNIGVQCVVGGTNINSEKSRLSSQRTDILVATPGRLKDHIFNSGLDRRLQGVRFFILDEADRLLDAGFRPEIEKIIESLPNRMTLPRQTLLFSATVSPEVRRIAGLALLPNHHYISTVAEAEESTHEHVTQTYSLVPRASHFATVSTYISVHASTQPKAKVIVFLATAREAALYGTLFDTLSSDTGLPAFQIHSRLSQSARTRATDGFKNAERAVMFASDVIARGIDISGITSVVQVGVPANAEQYVHRLGRTARAGESGEGWIILDPSEDFFLTKLGRDTIKSHPSEQFPASTIVQWQQKVDMALDAIPDDVKGQAYAAWMGYQNGLCKQLRWSKTELVQHANAYATDVLKYKGDEHHHLPPITAKAVGMMALREQRPLMNVVSELPNKGRGEGTANGSRSNGSSRGSHGGNRGGEPARRRGRGRGRGN